MTTQFDQWFDDERSSSIDYEIESDCDDVDYDIMDDKDEE